MNHRETVAGMDVPRNWMPQAYAYHNWNLASVKGGTQAGPGSLLLYGNIGIVQTDSLFRTFTSFTKGMPGGTDHQKIADVLYSPKGHLYAATLTGLYAFDRGTHQWKPFPTLRGERLTALAVHHDTVWALSRNALYGAPDGGIQSQFSIQPLQAPQGYNAKVTWFKTLWQIHSGEWLGMAGKLGVDLLGAITMVLALTGILRFIAPGWMTRRRNRQKHNTRLAHWNRTALRWHNATGAWLVIPLLVLFATGIFLRPPLLIPIAGAETKPIPGTHLDQPNPWHDKMRDVIYDTQRQQWMLATSEGFYALKQWQSVPQKLAHQPPVSVMGITVLENAGNGAFLVGSFSGLFVWNPEEDVIWNALTWQPHQPATGGRPVGDRAISGYVETLAGHRVAMDYAQGALAIGSTPFAAMPPWIAQMPMSLWNACLEIHTGRILEPLLGVFYILWIPITGLASIVVTLSGYLLWRSAFRKKKTQR